MRAGSEEWVGTESRERTVVKGADRDTLQPCALGRVAGATVFTDEAVGYGGQLNMRRKSVNYSMREYAHGMAYANGVESFRVMPRCG